MKKILKKSMALLMSVLMVSTCMALPSNAFANVSGKTSTINDNLDYVEGEAIVVLDSDANEKCLRNTSKNFGTGLTLVNSYDFSNSDSVNYTRSTDDIDSLQIATFKSDTLSTEELVKKLAKNNNVEYVIPNYIFKTTSITDDEYSQYQWALQNNSHNSGTENFDTNADSLWDDASNSEEEQIVAVLDTGIDFNNKDLKNSIWVNPYGSKLVGKYGYDFTLTNADGKPVDDNGHGTHVSGIIAAEGDNQVGISGINKSNVKIMALKWLDEDGTGEFDSVIAAYEYVYRAMTLGANVVAVNNSWGGIADEATKCLFDSLFDKVGELGAVSFVAAGNDGIDFTELDEEYGSYDDELIQIPAACDSKYSITVAASNENDELASFSNYNSDYTDIASPGTNILSTVSYDCFNPSIYDDSKIEKLCSYYNNFDNMASNEFSTTPNVNFTSLNNTDLSVDTSYFNEITMGYTGKYFGETGNALTFSISESADDNDTRVFVYAIAYTLENETDDYSISLMTSCSDNVMIVATDAPASYSYAKAYQYGTNVILHASSGDDYWDHFNYDFDIDEDVANEEYQKSTSRKLFFFIIANEKASTVSIDDFAVSKQGIDTTEFERYDFYNGTSMATPYAAGAYALIKNAYPEASTAQALNILKNTGRYSSKLDGYTVNSKVLSLDNTTHTPPMINAVSYNADGTLTISGDFSDDCSVEINSAQVSYLSIDKNSIVIPDNKYSTYNINVKVTNQYGADEGIYLVSKKALLSQNEKMLTPDYDGDVYFMPTGSQTYVIDVNGSIGFIGEDYEYEGVASYDSFGQCVDFSKLSDNQQLFHCITDATYLNGKIYFIDSASVTSSSYDTLGYDMYFGVYDLDSDETKLLSELPYDQSNDYMSSIEGFSLATYNGEIYFIGGYNSYTSQYSKKVYKYNFSEGKFVDIASDIPEARAYGDVIQYGSTLVYAYGTDSTDNMPTFLLFDGKSWSKSTVNLDSDDYQLLTLNDGNTVKVFNGGLAIGKNNVTCLGSYVYGYGDLYAYSVDNDKMLTYNVSLYNSKHDDKITNITSIDGLLVMYSVENDADGFPIVKGYQKAVNTTFAEIDFDYSDTVSAYSDNYIAMYGDVINVYASPESNYAVNYIDVNSTKYSANGKGGDVVIPVVVNSNSLFITAVGKLVAPNKVTNFNVSKTSGSTFTLSWKKTSRAQGYQIQEYKNSKWTTIKTITSASTLSYKLNTTTGSHKYRVRAYSVYDGKKYYGSVSSTVSVYVPKQQTIKSTSVAQKSFTVNFNKDSSATGYQIQYSTSSDFGKPFLRTITNNKTTSYTAKSLKNKKYYVRVRSYKTVNGKNIYGAWSKSKTVTLK